MQWRTLLRMKTRKSPRCHDMDDQECWAGLARDINCRLHEVVRASQRLPSNVRIILLRQHRLHSSKDGQQPLIELRNNDCICTILKSKSDGNVDTTLFHLARLYDEIWLTVFQNHTRASRSKKHDPDLLGHVLVDLKPPANELSSDNFNITDEVYFSSFENDGPVQVHTIHWRSPERLDFRSIPDLQSLDSGLVSGARALIGIGTGGGSDVVSASILGHLFDRVGKEMNIIISTRSLYTGSQGKPGSGKIGSRREIYDHGGQAINKDGKAVSGTYRVLEGTRSEGRDLETIPLEEHKEIWIALDPGEQPKASAKHDYSTDKKATANETSTQADNVSIPGTPTASLHDQMYAILHQHNKKASSEMSAVDTIIAVDTGGDVFGSLAKPTPPPRTSTGGKREIPRKFSTPDQDTHTILEILKRPRPEMKLVLAVLCPGLDSPPNLVEIVKSLNGVRYVPTSDDRALMIKLLTEMYHMDGTDDSRFGKSSLCLLEALRRQDRKKSGAVVGKNNTDQSFPSAGPETTGEWVNLPLPAHVIDTKENPWGSFAWVTDGMAEIILVPMQELGKQIEQLRCGTAV